MSFRFAHIPIENIVDIPSTPGTVLLLGFLFFENQGGNTIQSKLINLPDDDTRLLMQHISLLKSCFDMDVSPLGNSMISFILQIDETHYRMISNSQEFRDTFSIMDGIYYTQALSPKLNNNFFNFMSTFLNASDPIDIISKSIKFVYCYRIQSIARTNIDIYNVCSNKYFPIKQFIINSNTYYVNEYIFQTSLNLLLTFYTNINFSLFVWPLNPDFDKAIRLYINSGFGNPRLDRRLLTDTTLFPYPMIRLDTDTRLITESNIEKKTYLKNIYLQRAQFIKNKYLEVYGNIILELSLSKIINTYLQNMLIKPTITSGAFILPPSLETSKKQTEKTTTLTSNKLMYYCLLQKSKEGCDHSGLITPISVNVIPDSCCNSRIYPNNEDYLYNIYNSTRLLDIKTQYFAVQLYSTGYFTYQNTSLLNHLLINRTNIEYIHLLQLIITITTLNMINDDNNDILLYISSMNDISIESCLKLLDMLIDPIHIDKTKIIIKNNIESLINIFGAININVEGDNILKVLQTIADSQVSPDMITTYKSYIQSIAGDKFKLSLYNVNHIDVTNKQDENEEIFFYYYNDTINGLSNLKNIEFLNDYISDNSNGQTISTYNVKNIINVDTAVSCDSGYYTTHTKDPLSVELII
jgi:hypothetical protein